MKNKYSIAEGRDKPSQIVSRAVSQNLSGFSMYQGKGLGYICIGTVSSSSSLGFIEKLFPLLVGSILNVFFPYIVFRCYTS